MGDAISTIIHYINTNMKKIYQVGQFEEFLTDKFMETEAGSMAFDDDLQDAEDRWFQNLSVEDFVKYGNEYAEVDKPKKLAKWKAHYKEVMPGVFIK